MADGGVELKRRWGISTTARGSVWLEIRVHCLYVCLCVCTSVHVCAHALVWRECQEMELKE